MSMNEWEQATRWAKARAVSAKTKAALRALKPWHQHGFHVSEASLTYQACRFCQRGWPDVQTLWKYGVRHYACDDCRNAAIGAKALGVLRDDLKAHAVSLRGLVPLTDAKNCAAAQATLAAARAAAGDALRPTVEHLQVSASDLVRAMAAVK